MELQRKLISHRDHKFSPFLIDILLLIVHGPLISVSHLTIRIRDGPPDGIRFTRTFPLLILCESQVIHETSRLFRFCNKNCVFLSNITRGLSKRSRRERHLLLLALAHKYGSFFLFRAGFRRFYVSHYFFLLGAASRRCKLSPALRVLPL